MKFTRIKSILFLSAVLPLFCLFCVGEYDDPSYYDDLFDKEFEFCLAFLKANYIFRDSLPNNPDAFSTPDALYEASLDSNTKYLDSLEVSDYLTATGTYYNRDLGAEIEALAKGALITYVYLNSPADIAGLSQGDTVTSVNDTSLAGLSQDKMKKSFEGTSNAQKRLAIIKKGSLSAELDTLAVTEYEIPMVYVDKINSGLAYIFISAFINDTPSTAEELDKAMQRIEADSITTVIMDLRNNHVGEYDQGIEIIKSFLPASAKVMIIREWQSDSSAAGGFVQNDTVICDTTGKYYGNKKLYILMDDSTAGTAEIVIYALTVLGDTLIQATYGEATFGAKTMQVTAKTPLENRILVTSTEMLKATGDPFTKITPQQTISTGLTGLLEKEMIAFDSTIVARIIDIREKHKRSPQNFYPIAIKKRL